MEGSNYDWAEFLFREETPDFVLSSPQYQTPDARSEFPKGGWLQDPIYGGNLPTDTQWSTKSEDSASVQNSMQLYMDNFEYLDLPPLVDQSPSPPTVLPSSSSEESCGVVVDSPLQPATIQIRPRPPPVIKAPIMGTAQTFTASHRIRLKKCNRSAPPVAEDEDHESTEPKQEIAVGPADVVPYEASSSADGAQGPDAATVVSESEVEDLGTRSWSEPISGTSTASDGKSSSQLSQPATVRESSLSHPSDYEVEDTGAEEISKQVVQHVSMKSSVADVDSQKSVTAVFHIKGSLESPPGIGSIHVNAVTISCSCDKVSSKPHVQATVCDCYDSSKRVSSTPALEEPRGRTEEKGLKDGPIGEKRKGSAFKKSFALVFLMGAFSASVGFFAFHGVWKLTCQMVRNSVQSVAAASDL